MTESRRPCILIVTRNLPPLVGGMERLNWHMAEELAKVSDVRIVGPEGSAALAPAGIDVREAPLNPLWKFLLRANSLARREAKQWKPDIVLAGSGLTAPLALRAARTCGAKVAVYVHGLDVAVKHLVYRAVWIPALRRMNHVIANSGATAELCRGVGIDSSRIGIVHPGVDLPSEPIHRAEDGEGARDVEPLPLWERGRGEGAIARGAAVVTFRQRHHLTNRPLLLSVGRLSARKGLREFVVQCLPRIVAAHPDAMLLIVGDAPSQALHAEAQTPDTIHAAAEAAGVGERVRFVGKIPDPELESAFRASSVHVFPVREIHGDPEGFGMVAVEAAAHGLPTVAFATGGVVDAVSDGHSGFLVAPGDYVAFAEAVSRAVADREGLRGTCREFAQKFAWQKFGGQMVAQLARIAPKLTMNCDQP